MERVAVFIDYERMRIVAAHGRFAGVGELKYATVIDPGAEWSQCLGARSR